MKNNSLNFLNSKKESDNIKKDAKKITDRVQTQYRFHSIETLPNLPNETTARQILESLANDEGILAVMRKYHVSVGALCELYPEGQVGVSDVCDDVYLIITINKMNITLIIFILIVIML